MWSSLTLLPMRPQAHKNALLCSKGGKGARKVAKMLGRMGIGHRKEVDAEVVVSYMGANSGFSSYDALAKMYKAMMDYSTSGQFIAAGFHMGHIEFSSVHIKDYWTPEYCNIMTTLFGNQFLDMQTVGARDADYIFEELGISRTSLDDKLIGQKKWPSSWQTNYINNVHPNGYGSKAIAIMIKQRMQELGYLDY